MRAFLGLDVPDSSKRALSNVRARFDDTHTGYPPLRWVPRENLHVTIRFLGDIEESTASALVSTLEETLKAFGPLSIRIHGISWFPRRRPTVLVAGIEPEARLLALFETVEGAVAAVGLAPERRSPNPHLTLARIKQPGAARFQDPGMSFENEFQCEELALFQSLLGKSGASYSRHAAVPLGGVPLIPGS